MRVETKATCRAGGYRLLRRLGVVAGCGLALAAIALPARSLVVDADADLVQRAPSPGTGFEHVGKIGGTTGVYLGEGWVLTAAHVGAGEFWLDEGRYPAVAGSWVSLRGAGGGAPPDLGVFRVEPRPPLPRLAIARRPPKPGDPLLLVGCGHGRGEPLEWAGRAGYRWAPPNVRRWGTNRVAAADLDDAPPGMSTRVFATLFSAGEPRESQAAIGDSGGAGFVPRRGAWLLAGIMVSVVTYPGQPPQTAVAGNSTHLADLSHYRAEILTLTGLSGTRDTGS